MIKGAVLLAKNEFETAPLLYCIFYKKANFYLRNKKIEKSKLI